MSARYRIGPCSLADLREAVREMRSGDRAEITGLGLVPRHVLFQCWRNSPDPRVAEIDTRHGWRVAAVWGDEGSLLDPIGKAWLVTTPVIEQLPLTFFREARREIAERLKVRRALISQVAADYGCAIRFFRMLGFEIGPAVPEATGASYCCITIGKF